MLLRPSFNSAADSRWTSQACANGASQPLPKSLPLCLHWPRVGTATAPQPRYASDLLDTTRLTRLFWLTRWPVGSGNEIPG